MTLRRAHLTVRGRVQGVGYRHWLRGQAELHDVEGWVRNRRDGSVEAVLVGPAESVAIVIDACRDGPAAARVESVQVMDEVPGDLLALTQPGVFRELPTS